MSTSDQPLFASHSRQFQTNRYVYPVLSRRAGGISIGVNLNHDRFCNFHCVYCQVDHSQPAAAERVDLQRLAAELDCTMDEVVSGRIFEGPKFAHTPERLRRLNDIALSGDGEPTASADFAGVVDVCAAVRRRRKLDSLKIVLITNASLLHHEHVRDVLRILDANGGEIWAKLDAGTEAYYRQVSRSAVPWRRILDNLRETAIVRPIVIQTLWMRIHEALPATGEIEAYCDRLQEILEAGGRISLVQTHTVARKTAERWATALTNIEIDGIAHQVRQRTGLPVEAFYSGATNG
jgi:wyosine [tRNA(Phe)-imidazoG37] synthetase (radical SAM superfamily)